MVSLRTTVTGSSNVITLLERMLKSAEAFWHRHGKHWNIPSAKDCLPAYVSKTAGSSCLLRCVICPPMQKGKLHRVVKEKEDRRKGGGGESTGRVGEADWKGRHAACEFCTPKERARERSVCQPDTDALPSSPVSYYLTSCITRLGWLAFSILAADPSEISHPTCLEPPPINQQRKGNVVRTWEPASRPSQWEHWCTLSQGLCSFIFKVLLVLSGRKQSVFPWRVAVSTFLNKPR